MKKRKIRPAQLSDGGRESNEPSSPLDFQTAMLLAAQSLDAFVEVLKNFQVDIRRGHFDKKVARREVVKALFVAKRYENASNLSLLDWSNELVHRRFMLQLFKNAPIWSKHSPEVVTSLVQLIWFPVAKHDFNSLVGNDYQSITDITAFQAWLAVIEELAEHPKLIEAFQVKDAPTSPSQREAFSQKLIDVQWDRRYPWISVDLTAPDDVLIATFEDWLHRQRRDQSLVNAPTKRFTDADRAQWARNMVLAYLDLMILSYAFDAPLKQREVASLIFPDDRDVDVVERIRKVVKPLAKRLISGSVLDTLSRAARKPLEE